MKKYINQILALGTFLFLAASCTDDTPVTTMKEVTFSSGPLAAPGSTLVLTQETKNKTVLTISWPETVYPIAAPVKYALQIDVPSGILGANAWEHAVRIEAGEDVLSKSFTGNDLNKLAIQLGLPTGIAGELAVRVEAYMDRKAYSNAMILTVTPFLNQVVAGEIYMPGGYNGWDFATAATLSAIDTGIFQGYITFPTGGTREFKFTTERNWNQFYGNDSGGNFVEGGNVNLSVPNFGSYQITVNLNNMTYTAIPYTFGIIGTATAGGWDSDTDMAYDHINSVWKYTGALVSGALKFRLNDAWTINYGANNNDGNTMYLDNQGAYTVGEAGNYEVKFAVDPDPATATYSVTRIN